MLTFDQVEYIFSHDKALELLRRIPLSSSSYNLEGLDNIETEISFLTKAGILKEDRNRITFTDYGKIAANGLLGFIEWQAKGPFYRSGGILKDYIPYENLGKVESYLDIGCGYGFPTFDFAKLISPSYAIGVDKSEAVINLARLLARKIEIPVSFVTGNCEELCFPAESFDFITSVRVMPYVDNQRAIAELSRVLKKGGLIFVALHSFLYIGDQLIHRLKQKNYSYLLDSIFMFTASVYTLITGKAILPRVSGKRRGVYCQTPGRFREMLQENRLKPIEQFYWVGSKLIPVVVAQKI